MSVDLEVDFLFDSARSYIVTYEDETKPAVVLGPQRIRVMFERVYPQEHGMVVVQDPDHSTQVPIRSVHEVASSNAVPRRMQLWLDDNILLPDEGTGVRPHLLMESGNLKAPLIVLKKLERKQNLRHLTTLTCRFHAAMESLHRENHTLRKQGQHDRYHLYIHYPSAFGRPPQRTRLLHMEPYLGNESAFEIISLKEDTDYPWSSFAKGTLERTEPDGNCGYHALSNILRTCKDEMVQDKVVELLGGNEVDGPLLRNVLAQVPQSMLETHVGYALKNWEQVLARVQSPMDEPHSWMENEELGALANLFGLNVVVYRCMTAEEAEHVSGVSNWSLVEGNPEAPPHGYLYNSGFHYDVLIPL